MKECIVCKKTFTHGRSDKKVCSLECKKTHLKEYSAKWRKQNKETLAIKKSEYQKKNRKYITERKKKWRETKRPPLENIKCKECNKLFTPTTRAKKIIFCSRKCQFNNWQKQPKNKLNWAVQDAVRRGMKGIIHKSIYFEGLSFTMEELKIHLENQFDDWMNWDNHGLWHIDHIKPVASFDFTSMEDEDFKKCWALENLQPLKDTENMRKNHYYYKAKEMEV